VTRFGAVLAAAVSIVLATGCAASQPTGVGAASHPATAKPGESIKVLARSYLAIAVPANHRLEVANDSFTEKERDNLAAAISDLRAEASTERWFDQRLLAIPFPAAIEALARALVRVNQSRAALTDQQTHSTSLAQLRSFDGLHKVADAAAEAQVRFIRRALGLPPPPGP